MIRRFLARILMVILIAACGYNWLLVQRLQAEVGELKTRLAVRSSLPPVGSVAVNWPATGRDLRRGASHLKEALDGARSPQTRRALRDLQTQTERLRRQADALWREAHSVTSRHSP